MSCINGVWLCSNVSVCLKIPQPARGHSTSEFELLLLGIGIRGFCLRLGLVSQIDFGDTDAVDALAGAALGAVTAKKKA